MSSESLLVAGIPLILMPTVFYGGAAILSTLVGHPGYAHNQLRQNLWRAGQAHAGVLLVLSLVILCNVDEATLLKRDEVVGAPLDPSGSDDPVVDSLLPLGHLTRRHKA